MVQKLQRCCFDWFISILKLIFELKYKLHFFHLGLYWKPYTFHVWSFCKMLPFEPCIRNLVVWNLQKNVIFLAISLFKLNFLRKLRFDFVHWGLFRIFSTSTPVSHWENVHSVHCIGIPKVRKIMKRNAFALPRFRNSYFSVTTNYISPVKHQDLNRQTFRR